jgi:uncharacterized protein (DUF697 family)
MSAFNPLKLGTLWRIVSQVNIDEIRDDIERSFHLLVIANSKDDAEELARRLSDDAGTFIHPWVTASASSIQLPTQGLDRVDLAILLSDSVELSSALRENYRTLATSNIPTLVIIGGDAAQQPDAALIRRGEAHRIAVPILDTAAIHSSVAAAIVDVAPTDLRLALARRLPPLRPATFQQLIQETSQANATYSFSTGLAEVIPALGIPLSVGDLIVLTKNQLIMAYKIALMAGKQGSPQELIGEIVGVLGGGFLARQLARELVGLIPVWGLVPKVAIAYAGTWAIGQAVVLWAVEGQRITPDLIRQFYTDALAQGQAAAQRLVGKMKDRLPSPAGDGEPKTDEAFWQKIRRRLPKR